MEKKRREIYVEKNKEGNIYKYNNPLYDCEK